MPTINEYALISLESVRESLQFEANEIKDDSFLINLINRVSARMENYCGRNFKARYYTEYQDGEGSPEILLDQYPITYITGIWNDSERLFPSTTEISSSDYITYADEGRVRLFNDETVFGNSPQCVKICYSGGYDTIPLELELACGEWVCTFYRRQKDKVHGYMTKAARGASEMVDLQAIPREVKGVLDSYRKAKT